MNRMLHGEPLRTKWGTARINNKGYYKITSGKEGNGGKLLHRLIAAEYFGEWINDPDDFFDIHHIDKNPLNNCVLDLEPIPKRDHISLHNKGKTLSDEHKRKISEANKGETLSDEHKRKISESRNTTGYLNVYKQKDKKCKQSFTWKYLYCDETGKRKSISCVDIKKLEAKVKERGLKWLKF